jgi:hypothetical protein
MFGLLAFAEYPFAQLPNSGPLIIEVGVLETLTATDLYLGTDNHAYLTESLTSSDSYSGGIIYAVSVSESVTASDVYQTPFDEVATLFGFTAFAQSPIAGLTIVPSTFKVVDLVESLSSSGWGVSTWSSRSWGDTAFIPDGVFDAIIYYGAVVSESVTANDSYAGSTPINRMDVSETVTASTVNDAISGNIGSIEETITTDDVFASIGTSRADQPENLTATDSSVGALAQSAPVVETATPTDEFTNTFNRTGLITESAPVTTVYSSISGTQLTLTESVTAADTFDNGTPFDVNVVEYGTLDDVYEFSSNVYLAITETATASDVYTIGTVPIMGYVVESLTSTDAYSAAGSTYNVTFSESVTSTDLYAASGSTYYVTVSGTIIPTDAYTVSLEYIVTYQDAITASADVTGDVSKPVAITETVTLSDSYAVAAYLYAYIDSPLTANDGYSAAGSTYNVSLLAQGVAEDTYFPNGTSNVFITETLIATEGTFVGRLLWENIDDTQNANWGNISTIQTANWGTIDTAQTPNWGSINTTG